MTTNTDKPVGPGTFTRDSYSVTIAEDGKILVKKDDWLSKYSWALYSNYDTLQVFLRGNPAITYPAQEIKGIKEIENVDLIETGEYLIHEPTYFHWMEKRGNKPPVRKPKQDEEKPPGRIRSENWTAANLGGFDGTYIIGAGGVIMLAFRNLDIGKDFYYVLIRVGAGLGWSLGDVKGVKNSIKAVLSVGDFAKEAATANFVPVTTYYPFSADSAQGYDVRCRSWEIKTGVGGTINYSYDKITAYTPRFDYFEVVFEQSKWIDLPGIGASITGGELIWIW